MPDQNLVNEVLRLRSQNVTNDQIAQRLLYQGYSNTDVFDAMTQADSNSGYQQSYEASNDAPQPQFQMQHTSDIDTNKVEEIAESIIEDKWSELVEHVNRIVEWKSSMELRLNSIEEQIKNTKAELDTLHKGILGKIGDTDAVMRDVSVDLKALEQVFKKILPGFIENVNELSRITQNLKRK